MKEVFLLNLHEKLQKYKELSQISINEIAKKSNIPVSTVSRIFSGQTSAPSFEAIAEIAKVLNISLDELAEMPNNTFKCEVEVLVAKVIEEKNKMIDDKNADLLQRNRWIKALFLFLLIMFVLFAIILIFDLSRGDIGYFRY